MASLRRRTLLGATPAAALALHGTAAKAQSTDAANTQALTAIGQLLYLLAPLPAVAESDLRTSAESLMALAQRNPTLDRNLSALLGRLAQGRFLELDRLGKQALLRSLQTTPEFRFVANPAFGLVNNKAVWPRLGYEGPSFDKGGYLHRGFDDIDWLPKRAPVARAKG